MTFKADNNRIEYVDIARGLSMLCIIAGHLSKQTIITRIVFTFHVPIFFILSGFFFREGKLKQTISKLLKPYVFTSLFILLLECLKVSAKMLNNTSLYDGPRVADVFFNRIIAFLYGSGSRHDLFNLTLPTNGAIWFLLALTWTQCFFNVLIGLIKNKNTKDFLLLYLICLVLWLVGYYTAAIVWLPLSIQSALSAMFFMVAGYHVKTRNIFRKYEQNGIIILILSVFWGIAIYFSITNDYMSLVRSAFPNPVINMVGALSASWIIIKFSKWLSKKKLRVNGFFKYLGRYSIIVLSLHAIESTLPWDLLYGFIPIVLCNILIFSLKICCCLIGVLIVKRSKLFSWIYSI